jgi:hypothetical protein
MRCERYEKRLTMVENIIHNSSLTNKQKDTVLGFINHLLQMYIKLSEVNKNMSARNAGLVVDNIDDSIEKMVTLLLFHGYSQSDIEIPPVEFYDWILINRNDFQALSPKAMAVAYVGWNRFVSEHGKEPDSVKELKTFMNNLDNKKNK